MVEAAAEGEVVEHIPSQSCRHQAAAAVVEAEEGYKSLQRMEEVVEGKVGEVEYEDSVSLQHYPDQVDGEAEVEVEEEMVQPKLETCRLWCQKGVEEGVVEAVVAINSWMTVLKSMEAAGVVMVVVVVVVLLQHCKVAEVEAEVVVRGLPHLI